MMYGSNAWNITDWEEDEPTPQQTPTTTTTGEIKLDDLPDPSNVGGLELNNSQNPRRDSTDRIFPIESDDDGDDSSSSSHHSGRNDRTITRIVDIQVHIRDQPNIDFRQQGIDDMNFPFPRAWGRNSIPFDLESGLGSGSETAVESSTSSHHQGRDSEHSDNMV